MAKPMFRTIEHQTRASASDSPRERTPVLSQSNSSIFRRNAPPRVTSKAGEGSPKREANKVCSSRRVARTKRFRVEKTISWFWNSSKSNRSSTGVVDDSAFSGTTFDYSTPRWWSQEFCFDPSRSRCRFLAKSLINRCLHTAQSSNARSSFDKRVRIIVNLRVVPKRRDQN